MRRRARARKPLRYPPGDARLPGDFGQRLLQIKLRGDLTWEAMAEALGVDDRQLQRWRRGDRAEWRSDACVGASGGVGCQAGLVELLGDEWSERQRIEG